MVIYNLVTLLSDLRGRKTLISWGDMAFVTEITAGSSPSRSCVYVLYDRAASAVDIKLLY